MAISLRGVQRDTSLIAFVFFGALMSAMFLTLVPWAVALMLPASVVIVALIGVVILLSPARRSQSILLWTLASFGLHLLIGALITHTDLVSYFGPDARDYHQDALDLTRQWRGSSIQADFSASKAGFYYMLAGLYWSFGGHPISGLVVNAACAAALIPVSCFITSHLFGEATARWVPGLLTLTPAFLIWPSQLLREAPILLLISVAAASAVSLTAAIRPFPIATLAMSLLLLFTFRGSVALLLAGGLLVGISLGLRRLLVGLSLQAVVLAVMTILIVGLGFGYSGFQLATQVDLQDVETFRSATARDAASSFPSGNISSLGAAVTSLPMGATRVLLGPFPWEIDLRELPAVVDGAFMWVLVILLLKGLREGWHRCGRRLLPLILPAALLTALLAVVIGNYGLLLRERTQMMVLLVPLFALGLERTKSRSTRVGAETK